jgi:chromosome condensin MukBEF MukE localization factor
MPTNKLYQKPTENAMNVLKLIGQIFQPATELIDNLHTSEEEKLQQKAVLLDLQTKFLIKGLEFEQEQLKARASIITAEAKSESWITRSWRPITMLAFVGAILAYWFGLTPESLNEEHVGDMFTLVQIGVGGYIASRGAEKIVPGMLTAMKQKDKV